MRHGDTPRAALRSSCPGGGWGKLRHGEGLTMHRSERSHPASCGTVTSHIRLLFLHRSTCSGEITLPVNGPISVPALIHVLEKMPSPSPGMEL